MTIEMLREATASRKTIAEVKIINDDIAVLVYKSRRIPAAKALVERLSKNGFQVARDGRVVAVKVPAEKEEAFVEILSSKGGFKAKPVEERINELVSKLE